ncbi:hypothetical protein H4R33_003486 [Dimargaris cristalligena]|nr:hypothetical protein H4R33_003486 [Dimargaris cristalligena]
MSSSSTTVDAIYLKQSFECFDGLCDQTMLALKLRKAQLQQSMKTSANSGLEKSKTEGASASAAATLDPVAKAQSDHQRRQLDDLRQLLLN